MTSDGDSTHEWIQALAWHAAIRTGAFDPGTGGRGEGATPLVYVDTNPWGRHLDNPNVPRNVEEATAFQALIDRIRGGAIRLAYSSVSFGEGSPASGSTSAAIVALREVVALRMSGHTLAVHDQRFDTDMTASFLYKTRGIRKVDAIHAAASLLEGSWYFVTGDDPLRRRLTALYVDWGLPLDAVTPVEVIKHLDRGARIEDA